MPDQINGISIADALKKLIELTYALSAERHLPSLYEQIIKAAQEFTRADGATLYILADTDAGQVLRHEVMHTTSLGIHFGGTSGHHTNIQPIHLTLPDGQPNYGNVCAHVCHSKKPVNLKDVYNEPQYDFSGALAFDQAMHYRTSSLLTIPLQNHANDTIGVLQLINALDPLSGRTIPFDQELEPLIMALASSAAVTLDKQQLIQGHKDLLDAFIRTIAQAIDAKSVHTSAHCQRVPVITELLAEAACQASSGPLKDFHLDDDGWYELRVAAWLHDCGKLATPDSLLDKSTKLHALTDRIEAIQTRYAARIQQARLEAADQGLERHALAQRIQNLQNDCAFLERVNIGSEFMRPEDQDRVRAIGQERWLDYQGNSQPMLSDAEIEMLCIERGTLSAQERQQINQHIDVTIQMLESLPFPKSLSQVPEYAGGHHEKVNGSGFPKGLTGAQMSWPARMMAIADVFEALTARDRPYKPPMPLSQALGILRNMRDNGHIDPDLYTLFLQARVWETYGHKHLLDEQLDVDDISSFY